MENKRKVYEVLEEKISPDNIVRIGELLALGALKYMCGHKMLHGMYADLARDIAYKNVAGYVLTESYDLVQEAAMFLCGYMGMTVNDVKDGEQCTVRRLCNKTLCHKIYELWKVKRYTESMDALPRSREPFTEFGCEKTADHTKYYELMAKLRLTKGEKETIACYVAGISFTEQAKLLSVNLSTIWRRRKSAQTKYLAIAGTL